MLQEISDSLKINKKTPLLIFLLLVAKPSPGMESFNFLKTTTPQELARLTQDFCRASKENCDVSKAGNNYAHVIGLEIALLEIKIKFDGQEPETGRVLRLKNHAKSTIYSALSHAIGCRHYEASKDLLTHCPSDFLQHNPESLLRKVWCLGDRWNEESKTAEIINLMLSKGAKK